MSTHKNVYFYTTTMYDKKNNFKYHLSNLSKNGVLKYKSNKHVQDVSFKL